jgi:hypothetical protein
VVALTSVASLAIKAYEERNWPTATATIIGNTAQSSAVHQDWQLSHNAVIYQYTLWGKTYEHAQDPNALQMWLGMGSAQNAEYTKPGNRVLIRVNSRNTRMSVLDPPIMYVPPIWGIDRYNPKASLEVLSSLQEAAQQQQQQQQQ